MLRRVRQGPNTDALDVSTRLKAKGRIANMHELTDGGVILPVPQTVALIDVELKNVSNSREEPASAIGAHASNILIRQAERGELHDTP